MQFELTTFTSLIAAGTMLTLLIGYGRALTSRKGAVFHLVASICLVFLAYVTRTVYWDVVWLREQALTSDVDVNLIFDTLAIWGGVHGHIAIFYMIPKEDRTHWRVFTAWLYPPFAAHRCFRHVVQKLMRWRS